jgi:soluble lytic murein transglycosylase
MKNMRTFIIIWLRATLTAILIALPIAASAAASPSQDRALLAAHDAFLAGDKAKLARHAEKIRSHTLDSYVAFWRLRLRLEEADPAELRDFLARNEGTALAERLRRDWLLVLGKKGQWEIFREEYPTLVKADPDVVCYALQERWRRQDTSVFAEVKSFFMAPRALPAGCAPVVDAMLLSGELTQRDLLDRFRLFVQANRSRDAGPVSGAVRRRPENSSRARTRDRCAHASRPDRYAECCELLERQAEGALFA